MMAENRRDCTKLEPEPKLHTWTLHSVDDRAAPNLASKPLTPHVGTLNVYQLALSTAPAQRREPFTWRSEISNAGLPRVPSIQSFAASSIRTLARKLIRQHAGNQSP